jgi:hypothetical protein
MNTTTITLNESWLSRRNLFDWVFARWCWPAACSRSRAMRGTWTLRERHPAAACRADLAGLVLAAAARADAGVVAAASLLAITSYQGDLARRRHVFWLKYFLSSQSAILWMSVLFFMSTIFYWLGMFRRQAVRGTWSHRLAPGLGGGDAWR